jgi:hypothetical protein
MDASFAGALAAAADEQWKRDGLWRERPALEPGCVHDLELLPIIEFRQSIVCANCGGLDAETSRKMMRNPLGIRDIPGRGIYMDGVQIAARIRDDGA